MIANLSSTCVLSVVCTFSSYYVLGLGPVRPSCLFPFTTSFHRTWIFSIPRFRSFFPFTVVIRLFERFERFLSDSAVTYGDTTSNECDRAIKHSDKKGSKARRRRRRPGLRPVRARTIVVVAAVVILHTFLDQKRRRSRRSSRSRETTAGCLKADIFLLHIINDRLARNVQ